MNIRELLAQRREELKASFSAIEAELKDIDCALKAMGEGVSDSAAPTSMTTRFQIRHSMPVNDAVIKAVEAGRKTPVEILDYLHNVLGVHTTINSVRSRVSPLKQDGKIAHDETGWVPAQRRLV